MVGWWGGGGVLLVVVVSFLWYPHVLGLLRLHCATACTWSTHGLHTAATRHAARPPHRPSTRTSRDTTRATTRTSRTSTATSASRTALVGAVSDIDAPGLVLCRIMGAWVTEVWVVSCGL